MPSLSSPLDPLLRLGEEMKAAIEAEDWPRLAALVERRAEAIDRLPPAAKRPSDGAEPKREALTAQHEHLTRLLRERRAEVEDALTDLDRLQTARQSYDAPPPRPGVLHSGLSG